MTKVAALYVQTGGVYFGLPDVDPWDEARDARLYDGPWPVVAHPPCQRWCQLAPLNQSLHGYAIGDDGGTFAAALEAVERFGGVLEHPAYSLAWSRYNLPRPVRYGWTGNLERPGWACEVSQVAYGHAARKRTWLYCVGTDTPAMNWREPAATMQVSAFGLTREGGSKWKYADALDKGKSIPTPPAFREVLLSLARSVRVPALA